MNGKSVAAIALMIIIVAPIGLGFAMNFEDVQHDRENTGDAVNVSNLLYNSVMYTGTPYTGLSNNQYNNYGSVIGQPDYVTTTSTDTGLPTYGSITLQESHTVSSTTVVDCYAYDYESVEIRNLIPCDLEFTFSDTTTETYSFTNNHSIITTFNGVTYWYDTQVTPTSLLKTWTNVSSVSVKIYATSVPLREVNYSIYKADSTGYAQYIDGWAANNAVWSNFKTNLQIDMIMYIPSGSSTVLQATDSFGNQSYYDPVTISKVGNVVTISTTDNTGTVTAATDYYRLIMGTEKIRLDALAASSMPGIGNIPSVISTATITPKEIPLLGGHIDGVTIADDGSIIYRVDDTQIISGTYPTIKNQTITSGNYDLTSYQSQIRTGTSGTSITFSGTTYAVSNDKITVGGHSFNVKDLTFRSVSDGTVYHNKINGYSVGTTALPATITLNGNWSSTVTVAPVTVEQYTSNEWVPGHFAFDIDDFALMGIIISVVAFVGLGLYARNHGSNSVLPLLAICGLAAAIFLIML